MKWDGAALHAAARNNDAAAAQAELQRGVNVNIKSAVGCTPLLVASRHNACQVLQILLQHRSINLHAQDSVRAELTQIKMGERERKKAKERKGKQIKSCCPT